MQQLGVRPPVGVRLVGAFFCRRLLAWAQTLVLLINRVEMPIQILLSLLQFRIAADVAILVLRDRAFIFFNLLGILLVITVKQLDNGLLAMKASHARVTLSDERAAVLRKEVDRLIVLILGIGLVSLLLSLLEFRHLVGIAAYSVTEHAAGKVLVEV